MKTIQEQIEIMQHFANGAEIEFVEHEKLDWTYTEKPVWNWKKCDYRIKEQKKTIIIQKWLVLLPDEDEYKAIETSNIKSYESTLCEVIKLLDTYEVEL